MTFKSFWAEQTGWPHGKCSNETRDTVCFYAHGTLENGLRTVRRFQDALNERYAPHPGKRDRGSVTEYTLIGAVEIPDHTAEDSLHAVGVLSADAVLRNQLRESEEQR